MYGLVSFISHQHQGAILSNMLETLSYRGPDDSGVYIDEISQQQIHLAQNRLSIQDTSSKGHQPIISDCGNYVLVFNGEIYCMAK